MVVTVVAAKQGNIQNVGDDDINRSGTKQHHVHNTRFEIAFHPSSIQRSVSCSKFTLTAMVTTKKTMLK